MMARRVGPTGGPWDKLVAIATGLPSAATTLAHRQKAEAASAKVDRRTLRRTNRTKQLNVNVTPDFHAELVGVAKQRGVVLAILLEEMLAAYKKGAVR